jgi:hypothetical protein
MNPRWLDDSDDDLQDQEFSDDDQVDDDSAELITCPACGAGVYEESEQCPACGAYIVHDTSIWAGRSTWWIVLALLGIVAVVVTLTLGSFGF